MHSRQHTFSLSTYDTVGEAGCSGLTAPVEVGAVDGSAECDVAGGAGLDRLAPVSEILIGPVEMALAPDKDILTGARSSALPSPSAGSVGFLPSWISSCRLCQKAICPAIGADFFVAADARLPSALRFLVFFASSFASILSLLDVPPGGVSVMTFSLGNTWGSQYLTRMAGLKSGLNEMCSMARVTSLISGTNTPRWMVDTVTGFPAMVSSRIILNFCMAARASSTVQNSANPKLNDSFVS